MKIGYLGPGTYTEAAVEPLLAKLQLPSPELFPVENLDGLFDDLRMGTFDAVIAPLTNTIAGDYKETVRAIQSQNLNQVGNTILKIELAIGIHPDTTREQITELWSKDTALEECSDYIAKHFPDAKLVDVASTGFAMKQIAEGKLLHVAAIGSERGLRLYKLHELARGIENPVDNFTTFGLLERSKLGEAEQ